MTSLRIDMSTTRKANERVAHSPLPWGIANILGETSIKFEGPKGQDYIAMVYDEGEYNGRLPVRANAEHICRCVNSFPDLLAALKRLLREADDDGITQDGVDVALAAIAKAEQGTE